MLLSRSGKWAIRPIFFKEILFLDFLEESLLLAIVLHGADTVWE